MTIMSAMLSKDFQKQRHLLHDISNKLSIAEGNLSYFIKVTNDETISLHEVIKSQQYLKESISVLKELRSLVRELENKQS